MQEARVRLAGTRPEDLDDICEDVGEIAESTGVSLSGPIPLPTKTLEVPARKSPDGEGTATWEHWEMRVHKRLIDIDAEERALRQLMRIQVPNDVSIEIVLED
ncbi:MAG: SSU ribosomal protein S10P [uncultured archaeon A07HR60]|jgi:SSU ribosomal protein S10P|nr:MAG: SSU ribosomal protein S10P [Halorubrum sp. J07HR59]ESS11378.1 MAG: SSU ribosomal protein S10P [uncultured archaeon A07HR60]